jgi:hypothetical protein
MHQGKFDSERCTQELICVVACTRRPQSDHVGNGSEGNELWELNNPEFLKREPLLSCNQLSQQYQFWINKKIACDILAM